MCWDSLVPSPSADFEIGDRKVVRAEVHEGSGVFEPCGCRPLVNFLARELFVVARDSNALSISRVVVYWEENRKTLFLHLTRNARAGERHSYRPTVERLNPYRRRTRNLCRAFEDQPQSHLVQSVRSVIDHMRSLGLNLPSFLWAISWNIDELTADSIVASERTALMVSEELPEILANWRRRPRKHNAGICIKAACDTMTTFALNTVRELVGGEMGALTNVMRFPLGDLSEESLLGIHWKDLISEVKACAPTTWSLFHHSASGLTESPMKDYETVCRFCLES